MKILNNLFLQYTLAIVTAVVTHYLHNLAINATADLIAETVVLVFKWCSIPMLSLAIMSAATALEDKKALYTLGSKVFKYTLLTTVIAATLALFLFMIFKPTNPELSKFSANLPQTNSNIFGLLLVGCLMVSILSSIIVLSLKQKVILKFNTVVTQAYTLIMAFLQFLIKFMPIAVWAFVSIFLHEVTTSLANSLLLYLTCVILANIFQATVILPLLLRYKNITSRTLVANMWPAINIAFWSKSSGVALPVALDCAIQHAKLNPRVAKFSLPICTTINMNACSAFILITVLFVSTSYGVSYGPWDLLLWIGIATLAAIGNASVPMGCFTMSLALLAFINVPLDAMAIILPFYAMLDMLESAINIWSDSCVTALVDSELAPPSVTQA